MANAPFTITVHPGAILSADEYVALPEEPGWRNELTEGRLIRMPKVRDLWHERVVENLAKHLAPYVSDDKLGKITYQEEKYDITPTWSKYHTLWAPDIAFLRAERVPLVLGVLSHKQYAPLAPDLVAEVISPFRSRNEAISRAQAWIAAGTQLVWNIWKDTKRVDIWTSDFPMYSLSIYSTLDGLSIVPGFSMRVAHIFA